MKKIGIIICARCETCGGKCFRAIRERVGAFSGYPKDKPAEIVGTSPIPLKYMKIQEQLDLWKEAGMEELASPLMREDPRIMEAYN